jgi:hypothetical protein
MRLSLYTGLLVLTITYRSLVSGLVSQNPDMTSSLLGLGPLPVRVTSISTHHQNESK